MDWIQSLRLGAAEELLSIVGIALLVGSAWGQGRRDGEVIGRSPDAAQRAALAAWCAADPGSILFS